MFKNKNSDGSLKLCGAKVQKLRKDRAWSQRELADQLQLKGLDINMKAIQLIESGERFVTELVFLLTTCFLSRVRFGAADANVVTA